MARLPESFGDHDSIEEMEIGSEGWAVPRAMACDLHWNCYLRAEYTIHREPGGTVRMRVRRDERGYHVWLAGNHRYRRERFAASSDKYIPVSTVNS